MKFDFATIGLAVAVIAFYARLLMAQRRKTIQWEESQGWPKKKRQQMKISDKKPIFGTFSRNRRDWVIGAVGYLLMMLGIVIYVGWLNAPTLKPMWWFPVAAGIILFSWFFS